MKMKHPIDLHKGLTAIVVLGLMAHFDNFSLGPWVYLALHGTYGIMWILKSRIFPDPAWEEEIPTWKAMGVFVTLLAYWVAPWLLVTGGEVPPPWLVCLAVTVNILGVFLHFSSDAHKHFVLKARRGLITDGFFARTRNPNYLGEILIYSGFAIISMHWIPFVILGGFVAGIFLPNMIRKDRSMSRYDEWDDYTARSGLLFPKMF